MLKNSMFLNGLMTGRSMIGIFSFGSVTLLRLAQKFFPRFLPCLALGLFGNLKSTHFEVEVGKQ